MTFKSNILYVLTFWIIGSILFFTWYLNIPVLENTDQLNEVIYTKNNAVEKLLRFPGIYYSLGSPIILSLLASTFLGILTTKQSATMQLFYLGYIILMIGLYLVLFGLLFLLASNEELEEGITKDILLSIFKRIPDDYTAYLENNFYLVIGISMAVHMLSVILGTGAYTFEGRIVNFAIVLTLLFTSLFIATA